MFVLKKDFQTGLTACVSYAPSNDGQNNENKTQIFYQRQLYLI